MRVGAPDQVEFPLASPLLDLLFPTDRCLDRIVLLKPNQSVDAIARCEAWDGLALVLGYAPHEIGGHDNIQRPVRLAREQIDVKRGQPILVVPAPPQAQVTARSTLTDGVP